MYFNLSYIYIDASHDPTLYYICDLTLYHVIFADSSAGRRILEFIKNYPNCQDFFYALLSGRPLVISGPSKMEQ